MVRSRRDVEAITDHSAKKVLRGGEPIDWRPAQISIENLLHRVLQQVALILCRMHPFPLKT